MSKRNKAEEFSVADAISNGMSDIESLRDEMREWHDNIPESLQGGDVADRVSECADALDNVDNLSVPAAVESGTDPDDPEGTKHYVGDLRFMVQLDKRKGIPRRVRRDNAVAILQGALDEMRQHIADYEGDDAEEAFSDVESFCEELEDAISEFENAEFPSMRG